MTDTEKKTLSILSNQAVGGAALKLTDTIEHLAFDSLDLLEVSMAIEEAFKLPEIPERETQELFTREGGTLADIVEFVESRREET